MAHQLPQELVDTILDEVADDVKTLAACSLTCRSMVPRTRHYFFRSVNLRGVPRYVAFDRLLDKSPGIAQHVRCVTISKPHPGPLGRRTQTDKYLPRIMGRLPNARQLAVEHWRCAAMSMDTRAQLPAYMASVRVLRLGPQIHFTPSVLALLLLSCPKISGLVLESACHGLLEPGKSRTTVGSTLVRLSTLKLGDDSTVLTAVALGLGPTLSKLHVQFDESPGPSVLNQLLSRCTAELKHLMLFYWKTYYDGRTRESSEKLRLDLTPGLISLHIYTYTSRRMGRFDPLKDFHFTMLAQITRLHTRLQRLHVVTTFGHLRYLSESFNAATFGLLDEHLARIGKDRLLTVIIEVCVEHHHTLDYAMRETVQLCQRELARFLSTGGRLRLVFGHHWKEDIAFGGSLVGELREWSHTL